MTSTPNGTGGRPPRRRGGDGSRRRQPQRPGSSPQLSGQIQDWVGAIEDRLFERAAAVRLVFLALVARTHVLLLGPPGTGKSMLAELACESVEGNLFRTLLTRFSAPEDVFGPLSLPRLEEGAYERIVERYLPWADVAFLDEVYKANASILNSLLSILNERVYYNGSKRVEVPLRSVVAASNEVPDPEDGLDALDDRLLFRVCVDQLQEEKSFAQLLEGTGARSLPRPLARSQVETLRGQASSRGISVAAMDGIKIARFAAREGGLKVSDRRWRQVVDVMRVMAAIDGLDEVGVGHLGVLRFALWRRPEDQAAVRDLLGKMIDEMEMPSVTASGTELTRTLDSLGQQLDQHKEKYKGYYQGLDAEGLRETLKKCRGAVEAAWDRHDELLEALETPTRLWTPFLDDVTTGSKTDARTDRLLRHELVEAEPRDEDCAKQLRQFRQWRDQARSQRRRPHAS